MNEEQENLESVEEDQEVFGPQLEPSVEEPEEVQEDLNEEEDIQEEEPEPEPEPEVRSNGRPVKPRVPKGCRNCHQGDRGYDKPRKRDYPKGRF